MKLRDTILTLAMVAKYVGSGFSFYAAFLCMHEPWTAFLWLFASIVFAALGWLTYATLELMPKTVVQAQNTNQHPVEI